MKNFVCLFTCCIVASFVATPVDAQFSSLVSRVPSSANVLMLIDVDKLQASPLAQREGWATRHERMFESGMIAIPPKCSAFVSSAKFDLDSMKAEWNVSVMKLKHEPSMAELALRYNGTVDSIQNREVAVLPGDVYVVKLNSDLVAMGTPATRQDVGRWMNRIYGTTPITHSPYLVEAQKFAENGAAMIFALDLTHAVAPELIKERLATFEAIKDKNIDLDAASKALSSVRGVTLGVSVTDKRGASIKVDFAEDISAIKEIAKPLVLEVLARNGASISEFYDWEPLVTDKEIRLRGELFQSGSRRILSLLEAPPSLEGERHDANADDQETAQKKTLYASQLYFKSVVSLIDDLRDQKRGRQTMGQLSVWFDRYARKIDRLPQVNVDPDLLGYGKYVSDTFRGGTTSVTQAAATSRIQQSQVPEQYDVYGYYEPIGVVGGWRGPQAYGWGGWTAVPNDRRRGQIQSQIRTEQTIKGSLSANTVLQQVDAATADTRRAMTQRYSAEF